ncbi:MAG: hypothetical protein R3301_12440 [Saprospiraceae bacterium]|nr:hypothetical protein [Saprospiraceae bacterium]
MDLSLVFMWVGFILAGYSVVGNDVIQTLGTFLSSNSRRPWWLLFLFAGSILAGTLIYGWSVNDGDVSYARLSEYPLPQPMGWFYVLPPLVLMAITRVGIPVSTSFLILTFFNEENLGDMLTKSVSGYGVAFVVAIVVYFLITRLLERRFIEIPITKRQRNYWTIAQWLSTGFLWSQWLIQDFANIFAYLPRSLSGGQLAISLVILLGMLAFIFYSQGGAIQKIVLAKTNTTDIRSATIIDFIYGMILLYFKELNEVPMSTTWVFIGLLAGREIAIRWRMHSKVDKRALKDVGQDLAKVTFGLVVSIGLVFFIKLFTS